MSFESGSLSIRLLYVPKRLSPQVVEKFKSLAAPPIQTLGEGQLHGWVTGRHLLDRQITEDTAFHGGHLRLTLLQAERKVPEALLRAECRMEELARLQAEGKDILSRKVRSEIRQSVLRRLLPQMPPTLKGTHFVYDEEAGLLYVTATSDRQMDIFTHFFQQTTGSKVIPVLPETAAIKRMDVNVRDWKPSSYSPEMEDDAVGGDPGEDFLTWLWFMAEARGGLFKLGEAGSFAVMIEGPLLLGLEGSGAHEAVVRKGEPLLSPETKAALLSGKKLRRAKVTLAQDDRAWTATVDAASFTFRGLKLPEGEALDPASRFQERMRDLDAFQSAFLTLFDRFVDERSTSKKWSATVSDLHAWIKTRRTR